MRIKIGLLLLLITLSTHAVAANDIFIGMIAEQQSSLVLVRCDIVKNKYKLLFESKEGEEAKKNLLAQLGKSKKNIYSEIVAEASVKNDENFLTVQSVVTTKLDASCHLTDILDNLLNGPEKK